MGALVPTLAWANGGPVGGFIGGALGGGLILDEHDVRMVSEDLTITPERDGKHYRVTAVYRLHNPKAATSVRYGVPFFRNNNDMLDRSGWQDVLETSRASVKIAVGSTTQGCEMGKGLALWKPPPLRDVWETRDPDPAWCTSLVKLPAGHSTLTLTYRTEPEYIDVETSEASLTLPKERTIQYPLFPATFWRGEPDAVSVTVETAGVFEPKLVEPEGVRATYSGEALRFSLSSKQFTGSPYLVVTLDPLPLLQREVVEAGGGVEAKASSTLAPSGKYRYDAARMVDGKASTAWCEGVDGPGVGQWVELRFVPAGLGFQGLGILPGYTSSPKALANNGRPRRVRVSVCADPRAAIEYHLGPPATNPHRAVVLLSAMSEPWIESSLTPDGDWDRFREAFDAAQPEDADIDEWGEACLRIEILAVHEGARFADTCIAEIVPISGG